MVSVTCHFDGGFYAEAVSALDPNRTIAELKELRRLTSNENGAQRVAFTPVWAAARTWLRGKMKSLGGEVNRDEAGNLVRKAGIMAIVLETGDVRPGDPIRVQLPAKPHRKLDRV